MSDNTEKLQVVHKKETLVKETETPAAQKAVIVPETPAPESYALETIPPSKKALTPSIVSSPSIQSYNSHATSFAQPLKRHTSTSEEAQVLRTRCRQLGVSVFFQGQTMVRSLGITSAISGEGKTFLARLMADVMAEDNEIPVTLLECNWEHPTLRATYNLPSGPGLADWLRDDCSLDAIRHPVARNLTIIPAGNGIAHAAKLLRELQDRGSDAVLTRPDEVLIIDLPSTVTTAYGPFAAQLADALLLVVHMGVTPESLVKEACEHLSDVPVHGIILNQVKSRLPRWLRLML